MSGIKGVIKYISQLLILSSFSIIFLPIICLKCYEEKSEISIFKFMQWSIGKSTKSFLDADMEFVIGRHQEMYIAPEEMVGDRRSGMQRTVKTQATEYVPQRRNENRIKKDWGMDQQRSRMQGRSTFSGAIRGLQRMYEKKVYPMSMGEAVWICSDGVHIFMTKADQSIEHELLAEVFYVAEYEEYWLTPEKKRMVFLESGQPLGEKREYYIPRGTIIQVSYSNNMEPMRFELA